jgi:hypothetical protein
MPTSCSQAFEPAIKALEEGLNCPEDEPQRPLFVVSFGQRPTALLPRLAKRSMGEFTLVVPNSGGLD